MIDYWHFYGTVSSLHLLAVWSINFYLNFWDGILKLCTSTLFLLQLKFSLQAWNLFTGFFILSEYFHRQYFFRDISWFCKIPGHCQDLENEFVIFQVFQDVWEPWIVDLLAYKNRLGASGKEWFQLFWCQSIL